MKQEGGKKLMAAIRQVLNGQIYVAKKMSAKILEIFSGRRAKPAGRPSNACPTANLKCFQLIGEGKGPATSRHLR